MNQYSRRSFVKAAALTLVALFGVQVLGRHHGRSQYGHYNMYGYGYFGYGSQFDCYGSYGSYGYSGYDSGYGNSSYGYGYGYLCDDDGSNCEYLPLNEILNQNGIPLIESLTNK